MRWLSQRRPFNVGSQGLLAVSGPRSPTDGATESCVKDYKSLPHNENVHATLKSLLGYGLIQDDATSATSLAELLSEMLNYDRRFDFKLKWGTSTTDLSSLRFTFEALCVTVVVLSTRSPAKILFSPS